MNKIEEQLKALKNISPDPEFVLKSKMAIFGLPRTKLVLVRGLPERKMPVFSFIPALAAAAAFALILISSVLLFQRNSKIATLNPKLLAKELEEMEINIELRQLEYFQEVDKTISLALRAMKNNGPQHLNAEILKSEKELFEPDFPEAEKIDKLLEQLL